MSKLRIAFFVSGFLHVMVIAGLLISGHFSMPKTTPEPLNVQPIIEAIVVDAKALQEQLQKVEDAKKAKILKEQKRLQAIEKRAADAAKKRKQQQLNKKRAEQAAVAARAKKKREKAKQLENERKRKKLEKRKAEEQAKKAKQQREREQAKKEADRKRQAAKQKAAQEKMLEEQLQVEQAARQQRRNKQVLSEVQKYQALIKQTIQRNLIVDDAMKGKSCRLHIRLASNGLVTQVKELGGNTILCRAAKAAVFKSDTLPVSKEYDVYQELREINLTVEPEL
ncbi:cell envelope integrity protein TolA [uncultured Paraglaciecola sp.]|uniref:cell envelope integrity protein TolA n=1 Tax=uncultured Paraglaciecola sp. TaxID=1765024 RepID=UPI002639222C|nr:cell envelope integrity protein TolA [uncultured Paraglaciecola sp.]